MSNTQNTASNRQAHGKPGRSVNCTHAAHDWGGTACRPPGGNTSFSQNRVVEVKHDVPRLLTIFSLGPLGKPHRLGCLQFFPLTWLCLEVVEHPPPCPKHSSFYPQLWLPAGPEERGHLSHFGYHMSAHGLRAGGPPRVLGRRPGENQAGSPAQLQRNSEAEEGGISRLGRSILPSLHQQEARGWASFGLSLLPGRTERPSGHSVPGVGNLVGTVCAGLGPALGHRRGWRRRPPARVPLGWSLLADDVPLRTHQALLVQQGQVVFTGRSSEATCSWESGSILNFLWAR